MNNQQFRRLLLNSPRKDEGGPGSPAPATTPRTVLGARKHPSIPMTPRQVGRNSIQADFARQLAERNAKANPQKKFKSAVPKGSKLAAGYTDRTKERFDEDDNEIARRIKNLEESMKQGQIDRDTFEKLVQEITGGDIASTHLVRGLDRKLLERVRRGEDVLSARSAKGPQEENNEDDAEDEFDELAEQGVHAIHREKVEKKGEKATVPPPVAGVKRSRDDIIAEMKAQRKAAAEAAAAEHERKYPSLGPGFRKVNASGETHRIETDAKGREVLIITGPDGKEKRKVRKQKKEEPAPEIRHDIDHVDKPINMHNLPSPKAEESDDDIFAGVGSNYNPLAEMNDDDGESSSEEGMEAQRPDVEEGTVKPQRRSSGAQNNEDDGEELTDTRRKASEPASKQPATPRNYFASSGLTASASKEDSEASKADDIVRAALKKARSLDDKSKLVDNLDADSTEARLKRRAAELAAQDRDMQDIDMGFGASRYGDAEDMEREGDKVKFSEWKGIGAEDDEDEFEGRGGGKKRKRGPKKKKGDKNSAGDVLNAMERQKAKKALG